MKENFGLRELETFVTIAECGSFTEAARRLLLTQPTISLRISALEKSLSAKLLDRSRSRTRMTPAGEALLPHAQAALRKRGEALAVGVAGATEVQRRLGADADEEI